MKALVTLNLIALIIILLYLGDDFRRDIYNHDKDRLNCLKNYKISFTTLSIPLESNRFL